MKNYLKYIFCWLFLSGIIYCANVNAQIKNPVKWTFSHKNITPTESELTMTASIEKGWHVYGIDLPKDGPVSTSIVFEKSQNASLIGKPIIVGTLISKHDESFDMDLSWFEHKVTFKQKIKTYNQKTATLSGYVRFMCCNDENCLPPQKEKFNFSIKPTIKQDSAITDTAAIAPLASSKNEGATFQPSTKYWAPVKASTTNLNDTASETSYSLWYIFLAGLAGGLLALFTPCVWPIIPMTVSFFLKRSKNKRKGTMEAVFYGLSILVIYVSLGIVVTLIFGANQLNALSTNAVLNVIFFLLMVVFALSFLGFFELGLPASWSTKINNKADKTTGIVSILLMAFVLVIVSFSCTGPIIGTLLVQVASSGQLLAPLIGMLGFALALSLPFSLFALFPSWLSSMPKSGNWMNTIKVTLAFIELVFALKFLSVADMTSDWGILPRWLFIGLWAILALGFAFYLLGMIHFPLDNSKQRKSTIRHFASLIPIVFSLYMVSGYFGNPLTAVSAFLPPMENKAVFYDYDKGMDFANSHQKPVFIDFTGYGCVNCRKMEAAVFSSPEVKTLLNQFVIIRLYVDEKRRLPQPLTVNESGQIVTLESMGDKWSFLQQYKFGINAQPYYRTLDNDGQPLAESFSYEENIPHFVAFLKISLKNYTDKMAHNKDSLSAK